LAIAFFHGSHGGTAVSPITIGAGLHAFATAGRTRSTQIFVGLAVTIIVGSVAEFIDGRRGVTSTPCTILTDLITHSAWRATAARTQAFIDEPVTVLVEAVAVFSDTRHAGCPADATTSTRGTTSTSCAATGATTGATTTCHNSSPFVITTTSSQAE
jgi:hypothetical protein